jgi:transcriptional regulator with XRE-family HTH domain
MRGVTPTDTPRRSVRVHGPALRLVRVLRGRTIGDLARKSGVSTSFLARVERGVKHGVRHDVFAALVAELAPDDPRALMADPYAGARVPAQRSGEAPMKRAGAVLSTPAGPSN